MERSTNPEHRGEPRPALTAAPLPSMKRCCSHGKRIAALLLASLSPHAAVQAQAERIDYLTFAQGALPLRVGGAQLGAGFEHAVRAIDGNPQHYTLNPKPADAGDTIEFVYQLPAETTFDRFAVPGVQETPSPAQTFTREVEVHGSAQGADQGYALLASGALSTHKKKGEFTELAIRHKRPVRFVKLRLTGGIDVQRPKMFFEFSEIIGNGTQQTPPLSDRFSGVWKGRRIHIELRQDGPVVSGCYDIGGELAGTVTGNTLRAVGTGRDNTPSAFILSVMDDGSLRGVRSSNRAPFSVIEGDRAAAGSGPKCPAPRAPVLGCDSVVHGIGFDFDAATIRPESEAVLAKLFTGLRGHAGAIAIEGHTSSEGSDAYNQKLSERRAQAVVDDLVGRGIERARISAVGIGESRPIATNDDESGRALNRRVEVRCRS
jgi:outer membrane protein OmpA-like peptidoglycan-associated protein